ncbi:hypothetical protein BpHYR1_017174 [Brachionus plicatilis]|uniref:Uncharacterized protein n=1 Tax=Brachionus plicatilis TaxID=10195 RepID=A0A3M7SAM9_BRAPC|nr:hypothetical protein BpHYR1_017174 [Brachionus plicatilis]
MNFFLTFVQQLKRKINLTINSIKNNKIKIVLLKFIQTRVVLKGLKIDRNDLRFGNMKKYLGKSHQLVLLQNKRPLSTFLPLSTSSNQSRSLDEQTESDGYFIHGALARYR